MKISVSSNNLKRNLDCLFWQLNQIESITTKQLYDKSLELFNVEIRKSGRGHVVFILDGNGDTLRYPMRLSDFQERPKFYVSTNVEKEVQISKPIFDKFQLGQWARDLNRLVNYYNISESNDKPRITRKRKKRYKH